MEKRFYKFKDSVLFNITGSCATVISTEIDEFISLEGDLIFLLPLLEKGTSTEEAVAHLKGNANTQIEVQDFFHFLQSWSFFEDSTYGATATFELRTSIGKATVTSANDIKYEVYAAESWEDTDGDGFCDRID